MSKNGYSERDVKRILDYVGIKLPDKIDQKGNVQMKSPLREEKIPSFSINLRKAGTWIDFGKNENGVRLYRREDKGKVIRMVKGSKPKESWFGIDQLIKSDTYYCEISQRSDVGQSGIWGIRRFDQYCKRRDRQDFSDSRKYDL